MKKRPKTWKFSEYASLEDGSPPIEIVSAHARSGGTLAVKRPGRPWGPDRKEKFRLEAEAVIKAIRTALKAGATAAEIAAVLGIPEQAVKEFGLEV